MIKKSLLLFGIVATMLAAAMPLTANAAGAGSYNVDGVWYHVYNGSVYVTYNDWESNDDFYKGNIVIPASVTINDKEYPVVEIDEHAFYGATQLTSVTLPETVTKIRDEAFGGCSSLTSVNVPSGVTAIPTGCFKKCSALTSVTGMAGVTSIGGSAFMSCSSLATVEGLTKVETIGQFAFSGDVLMPNLPEMPNLKTIERNAFSNCNSMTMLLLPAGMESVTEVFGNKSTGDMKVYSCMTAPITLNGVYTFCVSSNPRAYAPVYVPYGTAETYRDDWNWSDSEIRELTPNVNLVDCNVTPGEGNATFTADVVLGEGVKEENVPVHFLAANDFTAYPAAYAAGLKVEYRLSGTENSTIATGTAEGNKTNVVATGLAAGNYEYRWVYTSGDNTEAVSDWTTFTVTSKFKVGQVLTIDNIKYKITTLGETNEVYVTYNDEYNDYDHNANYYKGSIVIPETVTEDGTTFTVTGIGKYAFNHATVLNAVTLPETIRIIEAQAFYYCLSLKTIDIPEAVVEISWDAFNQCAQLASVTGMENVTTLGSGAFSSCRQLVSVEGLTKVDELKGSVFNECKVLTAVPEMTNLKSILIGNFRGCDAIKSVMIPATIEKMQEIFGSSNASGLSVYYCGETPITLKKNNVFCVSSGKTPAYAPIYVPYGHKAAFTDAEFWNLSEIRELTPNVDIVDCNVTPSNGNATFSADVVLGEGVKEENVPVHFLAANDFTAYPAAYAADLKVEYRLYGTEDSAIATGTAEGSQANAVATDLVAGNYEYRWVTVDGEEVTPVTEWDSFVNTETGIEGIAADNAAPVYYNLQGVRVVNPTAGIYLERKGNTMRKVVVK